MSYRRSKRISTKCGVVLSVPEANLAHATATFSELGIATASILIADIPKWREIVLVGEADPIEIENLNVMARHIGGIYYFFNMAANQFPRVKILFIAPFLAFFLGLYALIGMSLHPTICFSFSWLSIIAFDDSVLDTVYWRMSLVSFIIAMFCAVVERSGAKLSKDAAKKVKTDFKEDIEKPS
jgi:hypothetical protein